MPALPRLPRRRRPVLPKPPFLRGDRAAVDLVLALGPEEALDLVVGALAEGGRFRLEHALPGERVLRARGHVLSQLIPGTDLAGEVEGRTGLRVGHLGASAQNLRLRSTPEPAGGTRIACVPSWETDGRAPVMLATDLDGALRRWQRDGVLLGVSPWYEVPVLERPRSRPLGDLG